MRASLQLAKRTLGRPKYSSTSKLRKPFTAQDVNALPTNMESDTQFNTAINAFRLAIHHKGFSEIFATYSDLDRRGHLAQVGLRQYEALSAFVVSSVTKAFDHHYDVQLEQLALTAAVQGAPTGLLVFLKQLILIGDPQRALDVYKKLRALIGEEAIHRDASSSSSRVPEYNELAEGTTYIQSATASGDSLEMLLCGITACAMLDSFSEALSICIDSSLKLSQAPVAHFLDDALRHPKHDNLKRKVSDYIYALQTARLVARPAALERHLHNLAADNNAGSLYLQWQKIVEGFRDPFPWLGTSGLGAPARPVLMPEQAWTWLLSGFIQAGRLDYTKEVWKTLSQFGIAPSHDSWRIFLRGCCKFSSIDDVTAVWSQMRQRRIDPDIQSYSAIVEALYRSRRINQASALFDNLLTNLTVPRENLRLLCNTVLRLHLSKTRIKDASLVLERMKRDGPSPTHETYNILLQQSQSSGDMKSIANALREMAEAGIAPDVASFTIVLDALLKSNRRGAAEKLVKLMDASGFKANTATWTNIMRHLIRQGSIESLGAASDILLQMESSDTIMSSPNEITYTQLMDGFLSCSSLSLIEAEAAVEELLGRMSRRKLKPTTVTYEILIKAALRNNNSNLAMSYFRKQREQHLPFTHNQYDMLLSKLIELRELLYAITVVQELQSSKLPLSPALERHLRTLQGYEQQLAAPN